MARPFVLPTIRSSAAPAGAALKRLTTPIFYLGVFGGLQAALLWELRLRFSLWIPFLATAGLVLLLWLLLLRAVAWRLKGVGLALLIALMTVAPAVEAMATRAQVGLTVEQDSLVQVELAVDRVLRGQPIYGIDWSGTELKRFPEIPSGPNPALRHFVYLPLTVLAGIPVRLVTQAFGFPFDYRAVLLGFLIIGLLATATLPVPPPGRFMIAVALFLNPLISLYFWVGRNDISYVAILLLAFALLARGRPIASSAMLGVALALKPFAVFAVPFLVVTLWNRWQGRPDLHLREVAAAVGALVAAPLFTIVPFVLADPGAFWRDTVEYTSGAGAAAYPIAGFGFGALLVAFHVVRHRTDAFPFGIFQLAAALPVLWIGVKALHHHPTLGRWIAAYTSLFLAFAFFARFFNDNYLGTILALAACIPALGDAPLPVPARRQPAPVARWH